MGDRFDPDKDARNRRKHAIGLDRVEALDWRKAVTKEDTRFNYGEERFVTWAPMEGRLHTLVWTWRDGVARPISLRKSNARERRKYEKEWKV